MLSALRVHLHLQKVLPSSYQEQEEIYQLPVINRLLHIYLHSLSNSYMQKNDLNKSIYRIERFAFR